MGRRCSFAVVFALLHAAIVSGQTTADAARSVRDANVESVVTVRLVVKERWIFQSFEDDSSEYAAETTGFVVAEDGTVVTSMAATDPDTFYSHWFDDDDGLQIKTELTSLTLIYDSGVEVPAEVVLRDRDLDLIFIRATVPNDTEPSPIPLSDAVAQPFDDVVRLFRFGQTFKRACGGVLERVQAMVDKPRRLYSITGESQGGLGCPIFLCDGRLLGMTTLRQLNKAATGERGFGLFSNESNGSIVVVSAADMAEAAAQIPPRK